MYDNTVVAVDTGGRHRNKNTNKYLIKNTLCYVPRKNYRSIGAYDRET